MASFTSLLILVACAALLLVSCEARNHRNRKNSRPSRRNSNDASIALGTVGGSDVRALPGLQINGPDVIIGFPNNCDDGVAGTLVIVSNNDQGGLAPGLSADNLDDPQSNLSIHCNDEDDGSQCADGITVTTYQYCKN